MKYLYPRKTVEVWLDPVFKRQREGLAMLVRKTGTSPEGEIWDVRFFTPGIRFDATDKGELEDMVVSRTIRSKP